MATRKILTTKDCGCQVLELEERQGKSGIYYSIEYCAKHKAAPDMYHALNIVLDDYEEYPEHLDYSMAKIKHLISKIVR